MQWNTNIVWRLRRIAVVVTLGVVFFLPFFSLLFEGYQRAVIRHAMEEKLESALLQTIRISKADFEWHKKGKEIKYRGYYFDVKTITDKGTYWLISGLYDTQEQWLEKQIEQKVQQNAVPQPMALASLLLGMAEPPATIRFSDCLSALRSAYATTPIDIWVSPVMLVDSPPPLF